MKIKRNRKVRRGIDYDKLAIIWRALEIARDQNKWLYVAQISKAVKIPESTIRYYLDKYLLKAVERNSSIPPEIRLRQVKLKENLKLENYLASLEYIKETKRPNKR